MEDCLLHLERHRPVQSPAEEVDDQLRCQVLDLNMWHESIIVYRHKSLKDFADVQGFGLSCSHDYD